MRRPLVILSVIVLIAAAGSFTQLNKDHSAAGLSADICRDHQNAYGCYTTYINEIAVNESIERSFEELKRVALEDPRIENNFCHQIVHEIGRAAAYRYKDFSVAVAHADNYCSSGYYHGVVEGLVSAMGRELFIKQINAICANVSDKDRRGFNYFTCIHGIGHGVTALSYYNLPKALSLCDALADTWERQNCYNGAFMENLIADRTEHPQISVRDDDPYYPCNSIEKKYANECYNRQPYRFLQETNFDFKETFAMCSALEEHYQHSCFEGIGREAHGVKYNDIENVKKLCGGGATTEQVRVCTTEAVEYFIDFRRSKEDGLAFCNALDLDLQASCKERADVYFLAF